MFLNAFDLETSNGARNLELRAGFFPGMGLDVDLLAISATRPNEENHHGILAMELQDSFGFQLERVPKAVDLSGSLLNSWVSQPLELQPAATNRGGRNLNSHFQRVAVVAAGLKAGAQANEPWDAFNRLFSLLAILPMQGIRCHTVAAPLFGLHPTSCEETRDYSRLLELCRQGFRHLPELHRLILFDSDDAVMRPLGQTIDRAIQRQDPHHTLIERPGDSASLDHLRRLLHGLLEDESLKPLRITSDLSELLRLLESDEFSPISLGMHARRLMERLVRHNLRSQGDDELRGLNQGIQKLRLLGIDPWLLSCMHQVRTFGNWMGHPQDAGSNRRIGQHDVIAMLCSLRRVLSEYPWVK